MGIALVAAGTPAAVAAQPAPAAPGTVARAATDRVDRTMGNGLGRLVAGTDRPAARGAAPSGLRIDQDALTIRDAQGRVLVQLTPRAGVDRTTFRAAAQKAGLVVTATDSGQGTLEGYASTSAVKALAKLAGTGTIAQALRPRTSVGSTTSQGVPFERVDKVQRAGVDGAGITIGALSDSYDTATTTIPGDPLTVHAADDVRTGDLPGPGNPRNSQPVVVIEDIPEGGADEGRGMLQIAHDVAPAAKLCFATAFTGTVGFADNIRRLADPAGPCKADVVVDDVSYFDEPFFSEGPIGDAVDDVAAIGVSYFSSVGNSGDKGAWDSRVRLLPAATGVRGTNIDLSTVDPALYDGGLQDMNPGAGTDVAQTLSFDEGGGIFDLQWDDPFDLNGATFGDPIFTATGEITTATPEPSFSFTPTAGQVGQVVEFRADGIPSGSTDLILKVVAPDGTVLGEIDTGSSPETLATTLVAGTYTVVVSGFDGATGDFTLTVRPITAPSRTTTDFNALFFTTDGEFVGALADANRLTGRPIEIASLGGFDKLQLVISRSGTGPLPVSRLRYILNGGMYVSEYFDSLAPATFGHPTADGATAVGAYDPFKSYLPESFTSPGGRLRISFDSAGNRFPTPKIRKVPQISATDGGNTTFFVADSALDTDAFPNFFGTSASAPHAAAIAALLLDKAGGPGSLTPAQVRARLQRSTYDHDLDPNRSRGAANGLVISADGQQGDERDADPGAMADPRFFDLRYTGRVPLKSVTFFGETASPTALTSGGKGGIVFDTRLLGTAPFRDAGFPFTVGRASGGLSAGAVSATFSQQVPTGQFRRMTLRFAGAGLKKGGRLEFGVDRDLAVPGPGLAPREGNGADELGGATFIPQRRAVPNGMKFVATRADGSTFTGFFRNRLGDDWTALDGYGVVDAEQAVLGR
ncbi:MAG: S8 family serine peptidase [Kineosporiaceae bacterium]